ncbi:MAG TPA: hypothetical protein VEY71_10265 [Chitinophagales bacterium]|nr:hypothetical protein [Chitinophagales bacterium]
MIAKLLSSRIIDILLIAAALYFLLPGVRRYFRLPKRSNPAQPRYTVVTNGKHNADAHKGKGQYIDYEEVK